MQVPAERLAQEGGRVTLEAETRLIVPDLPRPSSPRVPLLGPFSPAALRQLC